MPDVELSGWFVYTVDKEGKHHRILILPALPTGNYRENQSPDSWEKRGYIVKPFYMKPSEN